MGLFEKSVIKWPINCLVIVLSLIRLGHKRKRTLEPDCCLDHPSFLILSKQLELHIYFNFAEPLRQSTHLASSGLAEEIFDILPSRKLTFATRTEQEPRNSQLDFRHGHLHCPHVSVPNSNHNKRRQKSRNLGICALSPSSLQWNKYQNGNSR